MPRPGSPRTIRWRKGEIIGAGAYGRVYMGMNLDSGELLAVKQVLIAVNNVTKEKAQAHIRELEEEVRLLRNLSHPNIVRYLGTARENDALNILLEFVPGGSISSLLGKFGSFTEPVIRMYTKQLLLGLEYLHSNNILHRDIKGANILVDNKGGIKLADFGASKKVVELATVSEAKSMKGTPYWMAPEVIRQTGHNWQADIWSVGCTVIEMATGKPPWSQQFQEVAALFHVGTTKSHPPIPDHLSVQAQDFLLKCLQREPRLRPSAAELLKHPFVTERVPEGADGRKSLQQSGGRAWGQENRCNLTMGRNNSSTLRNGSLNPADLYSSLRRGPLSSLNRSRSFNPSLQPRPQAARPGLGGASYRSDLDCSVRIDSVRSEFPNCSVRLGSMRNEDETGCSVRLDSVRGDVDICSGRFDPKRDESSNSGYSVRLDSVRSEYQPASFRHGRDDLNCSVILDSVRSDYQPVSLNLQRSDLNDSSVRLDSVRNENQPVRLDRDRDHLNNCSVRLDSVRSEYQTGIGAQSIRSDFLSQSYNPMSEPSSEYDDGWLGKSKTKLNAADTDEKRGNSEVAADGECLPEEEDEVTESKIRAFLDEKAEELRRLQTPLYEEYNNIWNGGNENKPSESFIAPLSPSPARLQSTPNSKSPSKASSFSGRSVGMRSSRDSEASVSSDSPNATGLSSVNFTPLLEVPSPRLNEWKGLLHEAQAQHMIPPPSPSLNPERQRLWKEELQQELEMKREEKRKLTRQANALTNTTQSPNKDKSLQRYGSRLSATPPTPR